MSKNIHQVYVANPITSNASTDLMYFGQSPYGAGNDAAMTYANFAAQFAGNVLTTKGDLYTYSTTNTRLAVGTVDGQILQVHSAAVTGLAYSTPAYPSTSGATGKFLISDGTNNVYSTSTIPTSAGATVGKVLASDGTNYVLSTATFPVASASSGKIMQSDGTNWVASSATWPTAATNGKFVIANGTNYLESTSTIPTSAGATANKVLLSDGTNYVLSTPTFPNASATSGKFIISDGTNWIASTPTIPNSAGTSGNVLTSDGTNWNSTAPTYIKWNDVSGTSQAAAINSGYIISNAAQTTVTLPATAAEGSVFSIAGKGAAGWILQANTGQVIHLGSSATSSAGSLTSTNQYDSVSIVCVTADTTFVAIAVIGNLTVA